MRIARRAARREEHEQCSLKTKSTKIQLKVKHRSEPQSREMKEFEMLNLAQPVRLACALNGQVEGLLKILGIELRGLRARAYYK